MKIIFVGLSNKPNKNPLDSSTLSGALIDRVIEKLDFECLKTNLVNFAPINENGKLRYPDMAEKNIGYKYLKKLLDKNQPCIVVSLGSVVTKYLDNKIDNFISIKHPSYISIYRRNDIDCYIDDVVNKIKLLNL